QLPRARLFRPCSSFYRYRIHSSMFKKFYRRLLLPLTLGLAGHTLAATATYNDDSVPPFVADFEHYIATTVAPEVPGAALAIVADGKLQVLKTYGVREVGTNSPVTVDTVFRLASISKTVASTAAGLLVQNHQLMWDANVYHTLENVRFK